MPCFSNGPDPGTAEYDQWLPEAESRWKAFVHVVDYYFRSAGEAVPFPAEVTSEIVRAWDNPLELYIHPVGPANWTKTFEIVRQILLHLDCDGLNAFDLNHISNFLYDRFRQGELTPQEVGYLWVLSRCFAAMRNNEV